MIDFPSSPTVGQQFTAVGVTWQWDGVKWVPSGSTASLAQVVNPNLLDNGDFWVDQHNSGSPVGVPVNVWTVPCDRWGMITTARAILSAGQNYSVLTKAPGFQYFLGVQVTGTGAAAVVGEQNFLYEGIEFDAFSDLGWGTANGQPATLSFWVNCSVTGNFNVTVQGQISPYRFYPTTYNVPTANVWTKITIPVPADAMVSSTNWTGPGNAPGMTVLFDFGCGSDSYVSTGNVWQNNTTKIFLSGSKQLVATSNAKWAITGVKLEKGAVATAFPEQDLTTKLARCQRYYQTGEIGFASSTTLHGNYFISTLFPVAMRATPTCVTLYDYSANVSGITLGPVAAPTAGLYLQGTPVSVPGGFIVDQYYSASAEI